MVQSSLKNKLAEIFILDDAGQPFIDHLLVYDHLFGTGVRSVEKNVFQQGGHDGMEASRTDVFRLGVHEAGGLRHGAHPVLREAQMYPFGGQQGFILFGERILRLGENA